jgi:DNA-binding PadR family transcriptional regulator
MRVAPSERIVLALLADLGASYGLQLVASSEGRLKRGSIYLTLGAMESKGFVTSEAQPDGRRLYRLTGLGHRTVAALEVIAGGAPQTLA